MMEKLTVEEEQALVKMYKQVEKDFEEFPEIKTTEDLFRWREQVKEENKENGEIRNQIIEEKIKGNKSMELLYAWSKFTRMIDRAKANVFMTKLSCDAEENSYQINAANMLHDRLTRKKKDRSDRLFGMYKIEELSLGIKFPTERSFHTPYEYEKALITEDEEQSWPAVLFVALMNAYGIEEEDLLETGREAERKGKEYIADMIVEYEAKKTERTTNSHGTFEKK
jgi:hypothetical protein